MPEITYIVEQLDGDYAWLANVNEPGTELKCVARALLPAEIVEGSRLLYTCFEYSLV